MENFDKLTKKNAQAFFEVYMERKDAVLDGFRQSVEKNGGPSKDELNFSSESLIPLWMWLWPKLELCENHPDIADRPIWYDFQITNNPHCNTPLTKDTVRWIDGLAYYFGETVIRNIPNVYWTVCSDKNAFHYNKPVLSGNIFAYPLHNMIICALQAIDKSPINSDKRLLEVLEILINDARKYLEEPGESKCI